MRHAILKQADGSLVPVHFGHDASESELLAYRDRIFPGAEILGAIAPEDFPDWRWLDCWRWDGSAVVVDMTLARKQRVSEIRQMRAMKFQPLDSEWMRAMGQKDAATADAVEAKRQLLRDIPQMLTGEKTKDGACITKTLSECKTPEDLEALEPVWP